MIPPGHTRTIDAFTLETPPRTFGFLCISSLKLAFRIAPMPDGERSPPPCIPRVILIIFAGMSTAA